MAHADFEGVTGGGDVIVWDRGTWTLTAGGGPAAAVAAGELHFDLDGTKLKGHFALLRRGREGRGGREQWLLVHKRDAFASAGWDAESDRRSVLSGRTNEELASPGGGAGGPR